MTTTYNHKDTYQLNDLTDNGYAEFVPNTDGTVTIHSQKHLSTESVVYYANDAKSLFYSLIRQGYSIL